VSHAPEMRRKSALRVGYGWLVLGVRDRNGARSPIVVVCQLILLGLLPVAFFVAVLTLGKDFSFDFHQFWEGGRNVLDGVSPYPSSAALHAIGADLGPREIPKVFRFPYPAGSALAMAPLALLPFGAAAVLLAVVSSAAVVLALWLLEVRDWRCYTVAFGSVSVISAVRLGTLTPLILLALALAWRCRERRWIAGGAIAAAVILKIFPWPAIAWLLVTRRFAAAAIATSLSLVATFVAWAVIGFAGLSEYPLLLRKLVDVDARHGYSLVALGSVLGLGTHVSDLLPWLVGVVLLMSVALAARAVEADRYAFTLAVAASIVLTPIVWLHYFVLLYAPIAVWRRTLSSAWLLPLLFLFTPSGWDLQHRADWHVGLGLAIAAAALIAAGIHAPVRAARAAVERAPA
jgi:alpha-1,2-mannosyltransferase